MEQAEARAEFAERSVQKLQKEVDRLEGMKLCPLFCYTFIILLNHLYYFIQRKPFVSL